MKDEEEKPITPVDVWRHVYREGGRWSAKEIAEDLIAEPRDISRIVARLATQGMLTASPKAARFRWV